MKVKRSGGQAEAVMLAIQGPWLWVHELEATPPEWQPCAGCGADTPDTVLAWVTAPAGVHLRLMVHRACAFAAVARLAGVAPDRVVATAAPGGYRWRVAEQPALALAATTPGDSLRTARVRLGLRQSDLAARLGCTRALVSMYETGAAPIPPERRATLRRILRTWTEA